MRALTTELLLQQLPMLQRLMNRLVDCKPTGAACQDHVVQVSLRFFHELPGMRLAVCGRGDCFCLSEALLHPCHHRDDTVCMWQAALFYVLKESFKVYKAISEGLINLADKFFDMDYFNAQRALEVYKESILSAERLQVSRLLLAPSRCENLASILGVRPPGPMTAPSGC